MTLPVFAPNPFVLLLGAELLRFEVDEADIGLVVRDELANAFGVAHGGVTMTLLDVAMAHAARTPSHPGGEARPGVVTLEMKTMFVRPASGRLLATGRVLHRAASLAFTEGRVVDVGGELVAHATATFKVMQALPAGRRIQRLGAGLE